MVYKFHPMSVISSGNWQLSAEIVRIYWAIPSLLHITAHLTSYNIWRLPQEIWLPDPRKLQERAKSCIQLFQNMFVCEVITFNTSQAKCDEVCIQLHTVFWMHTVRMHCTHHGHNGFLYPAMHQCQQAVIFHIIISQLVETNSSNTVSYTHLTLPTKLSV